MKVQHVVVGCACCFVLFGTVGAFISPLAGGLGMVGTGGFSAGFAVGFGSTP